MIDYKLTSGGCAAGKTGLPSPGAISIVVGCLALRVRRRGPGLGFLPQRPLLLELLLVLLGPHLDIALRVAHVLVRVVERLVPTLCGAVKKGCVGSV